MDRFCKISTENIKILGYQDTTFEILGKKYNSAFDCFLKMEMSLMKIEKVIVCAFHKCAWINHGFAQSSSIVVL